MIEYTDTDGLDDVSPHALVQIYQHRYGNTYAELWTTGGEMLA